MVTKLWVEFFFFFFLGRALWVELVKSKTKIGISILKFRERSI